MRKKDRVNRVLALIDAHYPLDTKCYLNYNTDWQLLIATILSAQCTDDRVNLVTKDLFQKYETLEAFAESDLKELEEDVRSTGFYRNKAKNIKACALMLLEKHQGVVPSDIDALVALPGVGRKTANVIRSHIYHIPSIVVDTHVKRLSNRFGFVSSDDPVKIEMALYKLLPKDAWIRYNTQLIAHGRKICTAQRPKCEICFLNVDGLCAFYATKDRKKE